MAVSKIILSSVRVCRSGVWFSFVRSAVLLAVGMCAVLSFEALPGLSCLLRVTHQQRMVQVSWEGTNDGVWSIRTTLSKPSRRGPRVSPLRQVVSVWYCSPARLCFVPGCIGREDMVMTLLGVGNDGGWLLCWRRALLLCWLVLGVLIPGLPF